jgi:uncharacterized protein YegL
VILFTLSLWQNPGQMAAAPAAQSSQCQLDLVFVVDDTGSMGGAIANLKTGLAQIINDVVTVSGGNYQLGLVTFKDNVTVQVDLAAGNSAAVQTAVSGLSASNGNNEPEASDEALNTAINRLAATWRAQTGDFTGVWRNSALKTIILVTDARPAGFDDAFTSGVDDINASQRATEAANNQIKIAAIQIGSYSPVVPIMTTYATTSLGIYKQLPQDGSGLAAAVSDIIKAGCNPQPSDVWMMDNSADTSDEPSIGVVWQSPDIKVCNSSTECMTSENPVIGPPNHLFVTVRNNGNRVKPPQNTSGTLHLYYTNLGGAAQWGGHTDPTDSWTPIGSVSNIYLAANQVLTVSLPWANLPGAGHYCLLARWESALDPMTNAEIPNTLYNTRYNNNIAWRNVNVVNASAGGSMVKRPFTLRNIERTPTRLQINIADISQGLPLIGPGRVLLDLGTDLFKRWVSGGASGKGFKLAGGTSVELVTLQAEIRNLPFAPLEEQTISLQIVPLPGAQPQPYILQVTQLAPISEQSEEMVDVGGVEYQINILPPDQPAAAVTLAAGRDENNATVAHLTWTHRIQNITYELWRSSDPNFTPGDPTALLLLTTKAPIQEDETVALRHTDSGLQAATGYFYKVRAFDGNSGSTVSNLATVEGVPVNAFVSPTVTPTATSTATPTSTPTPTVTPTPTRTPTVTPIPPVPVNDVGDAPDNTNNFGASMTTFLGGPAARFPVVFNDPFSIPGPMHWNTRPNAWLGSGVDGESDADLLPAPSNIDPTANLANRDDLPGTTGIVASTLTLPTCGMTSFQYNVTVVGAKQRRYTNAWIDFNGDGDWEDSFTCRVGTTTYTVREWVVRNQTTNYGPGVSLVTTPNFNTVMTASAPALKWMRLMLSDATAIAVAVPSGADGRGPLAGYQFGETEDYLLRGSAVFALATDGNIQQPTADITVSEIEDSPPAEAVVVEELSEIPPAEAVIAEDAENSEEEARNYKLYLPVIEK